jgi:hypothetical protein
MSPLRRIAFESSRGGEEKTWSLPPKTHPHRPHNRAWTKDWPGVSGRPPTTESLVETNVADEALEPRDKGLPGVRIPSPWDYQGKRVVGILVSPGQAQTWLFRPHRGAGQAR